MNAQAWIIVALTLVLGAGMLLLLPAERRLSARAKTLDMWPDRKDEPPYPWTVWHEWTFALWTDLFRRSEQRDPEYLRLQSRVRVGIVLVAVGFAGIAVTAMLADA